VVCMLCVAVWNARNELIGDIGPVICDIFDCVILVVEWFPKS
jgi:hypothetical protein